MSEDEAGYEQLAARLGRVRQVRNRATALAAVDPAAYYHANGGDPDEAQAVALAGSGDVAELQARVIQAQGQKITALEGQMKYVLALLAAHGTELCGLRANVVGVEHRCTCTEQAAAEWDRLQAQAAQRKEAQ